MEWMGYHGVDGIAWSALNRLRVTFPNSHPFHVAKFSYFVQIFVIFRVHGF